MRKLFLFLLLPYVAFGQHGVRSVFKQIQRNDLYHCFGGFQDSSVEVSLSQGNWSQITNDYNTLFDYKELNGFTINDDTLIITNKGDYSGLMTVTFEGANSVEYLIRCYNVTQTKVEGYHIGKTGRGVGNFTTLMIPLYVDAVAGDKIVFEVTYLTVGSYTATFKFCQFLLRYLHD